MTSDRVKSRAVIGGASGEDGRVGSGSGAAAAAAAAATRTGSGWWSRPFCGPRAGPRARTAGIAACAKPRGAAPLRRVLGACSRATGHALQGLDVREPEPHRAGIHRLSPAQVRWRWSRRGQSGRRAAGGRTC